MQSSITSNPQIHRTIKAGKELDIVHISVGVSIGCEFTGPRHPVAVE